MFAGECRSQYGFCGSSFIYCNKASTWTLENCGLSGIDTNGTPLLCDADVLKCPGGEYVYKNPSNECEYFPCPEEKVEENTPSFNIPAPGPTRFSELPKPTLPKIEKASRPTGIVDLGKKPSGNTTLAVINYSDDVKDDKEDSASTKSKEVNELDSNDYDMGFGGRFSANDWAANGRSGAHNTRQKALVVLTFSILSVFISQ